MFRLGETEDFKKIKEEQKQKAKKAAKNHKKSVSNEALSI